ncbi:MAG: helix-turn-helix domain-containing protein [Armatimonadota bacterium]|nr:helix-turn-helix domain-containing protein [Armatimonadota bacterium]MDR7496909.1 helix-turn-helix domain-containing protein [Armatimonadota bacterium]
MKALGDQDARWLSLGEAASRLGVDEATLRHWADTGRIRTFRTPGGHRRFLAADLGALLQRETPRVEDLGQLVERRSARVLARSPAKSLRNRPWFLALDAAARKRARGYGRQLFGAIVRYMSEPQARRALRVQLLAHGRRYGREIRGAGLGPAEAAEAFGFFRGLVLKLVTEPRGRGGMLDETQIRTLLEVSGLLDEIFGAILRAWDSEGSAPRPARGDAAR